MAGRGRERGGGQQWRHGWKRRSSPRLCSRHPGLLGARPSRRVLHSSHESRLLPQSRSSQPLPNRSPPPPIHARPPRLLFVPARPAAREPASPSAAGQQEQRTGPRGKRRAARRQEEGGSRRRAVGGGGRWEGGGRRSLIKYSRVPTDAIHTPESTPRTRPPASTMGGRAGAAEPLLLPEFSGGHGGGGASVSGAMFNLSTSIIGTGIMSIPAAMRVLSIVPALVLIAAVAVLSDVSVEYMLRYTGWARGPPLYAAVMGDAFGRAGAAMLNVFIAFTTAGTLVVYLIIIGDVMSGSAGAGDEHAGVLGELFGARWWTGREFVILVTAVVVLLPLVLLRRVGSVVSTATR